MKKAIATILLFVLTLSVMCTYISATETATSSEPSSPTEATDQSIKTNRVKTSATPTPSSETKEKNNKEDDTDEKNDASQKSEKKVEDEEFIDPTQPYVLSESAILVNGNTGRVLYEKNSHARMFPASTTKIMTAYLALQNLDLKQEIVASESAVAIAEDSSKMNLIAGEVLTVEQLIYALMVQSANDAANALAEAVSGSIPEFIRLMNETAQKLGMNNTQFKNPHGYHDEEHYTTAYDMAIVAQKAMENEVFAEIVSTPSYTIPPTNKTSEERKYTNRNYMVNPRADLKYRYTYANGVKTGHTSAAGYCLVGSAIRSGMSLISVVFKAPEEKPEQVYLDSKSMYEFAYSRWRIRIVQKGDELASTCNVKWASGKKHLILKTNQDIKTLLPKDEYIPELLTSEITVKEDITAPVKAGTELGEIRYYYDKEEVATAKLYATRDVNRSYIKQFFSYIFSFWFIALFGVIVFFIIRNRIKEKKRAERLRKVKKRNARK